jgi:hypothetical protein
MSIHVWSTLHKNIGEILVLLDHDVYKLKLSKSAFSFESKFNQLIEALEQGKHPREAGATSLKSLELGKLAKAVIRPGNAYLTLYGEGGVPKLTYASTEKIADQIFQAIHDRSGRAFESKQEELGVGEALIIPASWLAIVGCLWGVLYMTATDLAQGKEIKTNRNGLVKDLLVWVASALGTNGSHAVGVILLLTVLFWAGKRIVKRPLRTVWLPART